MKILASFSSLYNINLGENYENKLRVLDPGVYGKTTRDLRDIGCDVDRVYWA